MLSSFYHSAIYFQANGPTPEGFLHVFPQIYDCEGFFVARLRKPAAIPPLPAPTYKVGNFPFSPLKEREPAYPQAAQRWLDLQWKFTPVAAR
ncbi:hypothetical protein ACNKHK_08770 [Shigella flexneri]